MKEYLIGCGGLMFIFVVVFVSAMFIQDAANSSYKRGYEIGYIDACKDFHQGKIKYELVEHDDGTRTWEKWKKENE